MNVKIGEKNGKKYSVYVDGQFIGGLYDTEIKRHELNDEAELSIEDYEQLLAEITLRAKKRVMNILLKSDRSEGELRRKLSEDQYSESEIDAAIEYVKGYHYIDEIRVAKNYILSKMNDHSEHEIRYNLENKEIPGDIIDEAYDSVISDNGSDPEILAAEKFVRKRLHFDIADSDELWNETQKVYAAAYRKGFKSENIRLAIKRLTLDADA